MANSNDQMRRPRGQGSRATKRLSQTPLEKNLVVRCSTLLYEAAQDTAAEHKVSLSDYVRELIIRDVERTQTPREVS